MQCCGVVLSRQSWLVHMDCEFPMHVWFLAHLSVLLDPSSPPLSVRDRKEAALKQKEVRKEDFSSSP